MSTFFNHDNRLLQFLKLALASGLVFFVALAMIISVLVWIYRDAIMERFLAQINKGLQTEVFIEDISVNVFRSFPHISISLRNVTMLETPGSPNRDTLLMAKRIYFQFSIIDILRKNYTIRQAEVIGGFMEMKIFEDGKNNYTFWKATISEPGERNDMEFNLQRVQFHQMDYRFRDFKEGHFLNFSIDKAMLGGNFTRDNYILSINGNMLANEITIDNAFMLGNSAMSFDLNLDVVNNNVFTFKQGVIQIGSHLFAAQGSIDLSGEDVYVDLKIDAKDLKLENFIADLPPQYNKFFQGYRSRGEFYFNAEITGTFSSIVKPYVKADFGITGGELFHRKANLRFENLSFEGSFNNGPRRHLVSSTLIVNDLKATLNKGEIKGNANINNFQEPNLDVKIFSSITADEWQRFLQIEKIRQASGELLIDVEFKGRLGENRRFTTYHFMASQVKGVIKARDLNFRLKDDLLEYHSFTADLLFNNNDIIINQFEGNASSSDFNLKGYFRNVLPWLFFDNERVFINASLASTNLNFNELLQHSVSGSDTT